MSRRSSDEFFESRFPGDRATAPTPLEDGSDAAWDEFMQLQSRMDSLPSTTDLPGHDVQRHVASDPTLDSTLQLARYKNRACPTFARWQALYAILPVRGQDAAPRPVNWFQWRHVSPMQKRLVLREQIEWAAATGALVAVHNFLRSLADDEWEHM